MNRLGEILVAKGAVSTDGLRSALEACRRSGGRLGTWLIRLGLASEAALLDALAEQTGCPPASALELATAPSEVRAIIPPPFARHHLAMAFRTHGRTLDVAMVNPNDLLLVDEIGSMTRFSVRPFVATEPALAAALAIPINTVSDVATEVAPSHGEAREWRQFWRLESTPPDLFRALDALAPPCPPHNAATFPALRHLEAGDTPGGASNLANAADSLAAATHRDQVARIVLDFLTGLAPRAALFSLHQGKVMAWAARGPTLVDEDFHTLILPLDRPSMFLNLTQGAQLHVGPLGGGEGNALLLDALGPPTPSEAILAPLRVREKVVGFLWVDRGEGSVAEVPIHSVREVARLTGLALEALVIRQKIRAGQRLTEGAAGD
ncbi:MAG: hypothetical protein ACM3O7_09685 [Acidobacteriota bacterium]